LHNLQFTLGAALVATLAGCDPLFGTPGQYGELGNGKFAYLCAGASDAMCETVATPQTPTADLATGARFKMTFTANDLSSAGVMSASSEHVESDGQGFTAVKSGAAGFIARRGDRDLDVLHLFVRDVEEIRFEVGLNSLPQGDSAVELAAGETVSVRAMPWANAAMLAGALGASWSISDTRVADITGDRADNRIALAALNAGDAELTVKLGEHERTISIHVSDAGGAGGTGAGGMGAGGTGAGGMAAGGMEAGGMGAGAGGEGGAR
jgi:hypothetical protein